MKQMILLKGAPGSGKTGLLRSLGLDDLAIGYDTFRELYGAMAPTHDGDPSLIIGDKIERRIVAATHDAVENRLRLGQTVIIDATNTLISQQKTWRDLGHKYGYAIYGYDVQGDLSDEELLDRNARRGAKKVAEDVVLKMAAQSRQSGFAQGIETITATSMFTLLFTVEYEDFTSYDKTVVIGDIHSCADTLKQAIAAHGSLDDPNIAWVFLGDLFDRGPDPYGVFELLHPRRNQANILLIEGNHETNLRRVLTNTTDGQRFRDARITRDHFLAKGFMAADQIEFLDAFRPFVPFRINRHLFFASHGGVNPDMLPGIAGHSYYVARVPEYYFIYGQSSRTHTYQRKTQYDTTADQIASTTVVQFHGHRSGLHDQQPAPLGEHPMVWNLESRVETGGTLSVAVIDRNGCVTGYQYDGPDVDRPAPIAPPVANIPLSQRLTMDEGIRAKDIGNGITAYNFTREVFQKGDWNPQTTAARGLFLRGDTVVARGYEKFFNLGECNGYTKEEVLETFELPVRISHKANGYLMIVACIDGELVYYTKSGPTSFAQAGQELFERLFDTTKRQRFAQMLSRTNVSVTFEVILRNDPHLVKITGDDIVFLDVINNDITFGFRPELEQAVEGILDIQRTPYTVVHTRDELERCIDHYQHETRTEGAILLDTQHRMTKIKSDYYTAAKRIRGPLTRVLRGTAKRLPAELHQVQQALEYTGIWGQLSQYTQVNPGGETVLDMPRILAAINFQG